MKAEAQTQGKKDSIMPAKNSLAAALAPQKPLASDQDKTEGDITSEKQIEQQSELKIRPHEKTSLIFQFLHKPEYLGLGNKIIINMDNLKAFGTIT